MSENYSLESVRRQAKQLVKLARRGDGVVIQRLRALLPRLAQMDDAAVAQEIKLADAQHAIARKAGQASWRALTAVLSDIDPLQLHAERFLKALRDEQAVAAKHIVDAHPGVRQYSIHTACAVADDRTVDTMLADDATCCTRPTRPDGTEPIVYAVLQDIKDALAVPREARVNTVRLLLDAGASPNASVPAGDASAPMPILYFPCIANNVEVARLLLERGANVNDGESLYHAAQHHHRECLELLAAHGADLSGRHRTHDNTPLYFLAGHRAANPLTPKVVDGMRWLLTHGADPNIASHASAELATQSSASELPLHRIAASGHGAEVARLFVEHGAPVDAARADGRTAYSLAVRAGNAPLVAYLASVGADTTRVALTDRLLGACASADTETAGTLLAMYPDLLSHLNADERQELGVAIGEDREQSVRLMLSLGWSLTDEGEWGGTPLHWAAWHGRVEFVRELLALGAPVNVRDSTYGSSPIAWTAHGSTHAHHDRDDDYVTIVGLLLDAGATRTESYNRWNESPESMASPGVVRALKARGFAV